MAAHFLLKSRGQGRGKEQLPRLSEPDRPIHAAKETDPDSCVFFFLLTFLHSFFFSNIFFCPKSVCHTRQNGKVNPFELAARLAHGMNKQACQEKAIHSHSAGQGLSWESLPPHNG